VTQASLRVYRIGLWEKYIRRAHQAGPGLGSVLRDAAGGDPGGRRFLRGGWIQASWQHLMVVLILRVDHSEPRWASGSPGSLGAPAVELAGHKREMLSRGLTLIRNCL